MEGNRLALNLAKDADWPEVTAPRLIKPLSQVTQEYHEKNDYLLTNPEVCGLDLEEIDLREFIAWIFERRIGHEDWRNLDYMWRNWKVSQIKADALMWMGRYAEAAAEMKSALYDIQSDDDKREAQQEGFYGDLKFLQKELKRRFQTF